MKAHFRTTRKHAFIVRRDDLDKIWKLLENRIGAVDASAECSDDMVREFGDLKQLVSYDNPLTKKILKLSIQSRSGDWEKSADVSFSDDAWIGSHIDIHVKAPEQIGSEIKDKISDILDGTNPWYSVLTRIPISNVIFCVFLFAYLSMLIYSSNKLNETPKGNSIEEIFFTLGANILLFGVLALFSWATGKLWSRLFPVAFFPLGQEAHRYKVKEKIRWVIIGVVGSLMASMIGGLIW